MATPTKNKNGRSRIQEYVPPEDMTLALDYLLAHKMAFTQDFLRGKELPFSYTKPLLRQKLEQYLQEKKIDPAELISLLNTIEGWGDQHIYLYNAPSQIVNHWRELETVSSHLQNQGLEGLLNRPRPLILPDKLELSAIEWSPDRLRFIWVEKRQWEERLEASDLQKGDIVWKAYRLKVSRGLMAFDIDLVTGHAMMMIQKLPRGTGYAIARDRFAKELEPIVSLSQFQLVRVSPAIGKIEKSTEVRNRHLHYQTMQGGQVRLISPHEKIGTHDDPVLHRAGETLGADATGKAANFYWLPVKELYDDEIHVQLYDDHRINIFGERREKEVRHVVSRVRHYCQ